VKDLEFSGRQEGRRRRKPAPTSELSAANTYRPAKKREPGDVRGALRTAYQGVIEEAIPPEMLDLLGKLG
jgi:hypothetical protein